VPSAGLVPASARHCPVSQHALLVMGSRGAALRCRRRRLLRAAVPRSSAWRALTDRLKHALQGSTQRLRAEHPAAPPRGTPRGAASRFPASVPTTAPKVDRGIPVRNQAAQHVRARSVHEDGVERSDRRTPPAEKSTPKPLEPPREISGSPRACSRATPPLSLERVQHSSLKFDLECG
ncbi:unnamed protein product, partial [Prorocentrum cordatum]